MIDSDAPSSSAGQGGNSLDPSAMALRESERRFRFLNELGEATRALTEPQEVLATTVRLLGEHLQVSRCAYAVVLSDGEHFTIQDDWTNDCASTVGDYHLSLFGLRAETKMRSGKRLVIHDVTRELAPDQGGVMFEAIQVRALICCPLIKQARLRAMMAVHQNAPREWTTGEISLLEEVVERCWANIERARLEAQMKERTRLSILRAEIASELAFGGVLDRTLQKCCELLVHHLEAAFARVWTLDASGEVLELRASAGRYTHLDGPHARVRMGEFKIGRIAKSGQPHLTNDVPNDPNVSDPEWARREGMAAFAGYPLMLEGRVLGVIALFARSSISEEVLMDLKPIADGIAQCIERKRAEEALHASETLKTAILNTSLDGFILMDHAGKIVDWNPAAEQMFGMARAAAVGRMLGDTIVPERLREAHQQGLERYAATRQARILGKRYELPALRADGSEFPCEISISHVPGTEPPMFAGYLRDITERQKTAAALVASEARLRQLADAMPQIVWMARPDGHLDYFNRRWYEFSNHQEAGEGDESWLPILHPDDRLGCLARWAESLKSGADYEVRFRLKDYLTQEYRWFLGRALPVRDAEGKVIRWFGTCTDIDDLVRAEEAASQSWAEAERARVLAENASRAKDDFLAALSHELRTPLTPVLMTAAALRGDERLPEDVLEQLGMMERNIALEARLIDDLLDLTSIAKGKLSLRLQPCDAHSLIGLAVQIVRDETREKGQKIEVALAAPHPGLVADPARFQQVVWNLLRNAVKFTPRGGRISIRTENVEGTDQHASLRIKVSDSGQGLEPALLEKIFLPFEQAGLTGDHRFGGMGLGLAIARAIVDLHGGSIKAESLGPNRGATFTVELPGATEVPSGVLGTPDMFLSPRSASTAPIDEPSSSASLRLLLVEDHDATLRVLLRLLTRAGHRVSAFQNVADALAASTSQVFDVVISDLGLPDGTGIELMERLRAAGGQMRGIALSGYGMEEDLKRSRAAGFDVHLIKPVDFDQLRRALREVMGERP